MSTAPRMVASPCRIVNALKAMLYRDPASQRQFLAVNSCTPGAGSHGAALLIDYQNETSQVLPFPCGSGGWSIIQTAPDRLLFESLAPLYLIPVDLNTGAIEETAIMPVAGNDYAWTFCAGPDGDDAGGVVYFGSFPTCHVYRYQPANAVLEDLGRMGPECDLYVRNVAVTADGWVLCSVGTEQYGIVAFNLDSRERHWIADSELIERLTSEALVSIEGEVYATIDNRLRQFDSKTLRFTEASLPAAPDGLAWRTMLPSSSAARKLVAASDDRLFILEPGQPPRLIWDLDLRGGRLVALDDDDRIIGIRGQDYFVARPLAQTIEPRPLAQQPPPVAIHFLRADPAGGVIGGPTFGQTLFRYDPSRGQSENTPQALDKGGAIYDGRWIGGKFYFIAYAGGDLAVWDPAAPWDQWNEGNPRLLASYNKPEYGSLIRPNGGLVVGPRGRLYSGWAGAYGTASGGLSEYDIATGVARSWSNDFVAPEMSIGSIAADERYVYGVTSNAFNGIQREPRDLHFWVFDPMEENILFSEPLDGVTGVPAVVRVPATGNVWLAEPRGLRRFDAPNLRFAEVVPWPDEAGAPEFIAAWDARDDKAWFAMGNLVVQFIESNEPSVRVAVSAETPIRAMTAHGKYGLYFSQGVDLWEQTL